YYGIYKNNNCLATITNNILSLGGNNVSNIFGIYERGSSGCNTSLYFNTVYISGSPTSGNLTSYALYSENNTNTRNFRNNIFMNERSNAGNHYAMYIVSSGGSLTCDYNDYIVTGTNGKLGYYNGQDKSALPIVTGVTGNDANSLNTNPLFPSPKANGTLPGDFKPGVNLHGVAGTGITVDFTGYTRPSPPTLGIYEINNPLPVTLSSFTSVVNTRNVKLNWVTASEINNAGFEIQRAAIRQQSTDNWDKIGFVSGKGTTNSQTSYTFSDTKLNSGKYKYRLKQIDNNGNYEYHNLNGEVEVGVPAKYELSQNYPNPFNPATKIDFSIPTDSRVKLVVYDLTGREIKYLVNEIRTAGYYTAMFDASLLSSGIYFYRFIANANGKDFISTKKMILLK
ncbi:MAG: T9SS type A sorting domain-containing protein, partial [Ignavibacteriota bacterium]